MNVRHNPFLRHERASSDHEHYVLRGRQDEPDCLTVKLAIGLFYAVRETLENMNYLTLISFEKRKEMA